jgi:hypothetical protein
MRRLIDSLMPDDRRFYWIWVGGMFAFYVALMVTAAGVFVSHESSRTLAHEPAATVAIPGTLPVSNQASMRTRQTARYD